LRDFRGGQNWAFLIAEDLAIHKRPFGLGTLMYNAAPVDLPYACAGWRVKKPSSVTTRD
jgi:hypothetical protein